MEILYYKGFIFHLNIWKCQNTFSPKDGTIPSSQMFVGMLFIFNNGNLPFYNGLGHWKHKCDLYFDAKKIYFIVIGGIVSIVLWDFKNRKYEELLKMS